MDTKNYNTIYQTKKTQLIQRGYSDKLAEKCARKFARPFHPAHRAAIVRKVEAADLAETMTGEFHSL